MANRAKKVAAAKRARKRKKLGIVQRPINRRTEHPEEKADYYDEHVPQGIDQNVYWKRLYRRVISYLDPPEVLSSILDLGCGPGNFAEVLHDKGYKNYLGIDFSEVCVQQARERIPDFEFVVGDLYDGEVQEIFDRYDVFICIETLEHLERDLEVVEAIPHGKQVIISVPNSSGQGHVRIFGGKGDLERRYKDLVEFKSISSIYRGKGKKYFFVGNGVRK